MDEKTKILLKFIEESKVKSTEKRLLGIRIKLAEKEIDSFRAYQKLEELIKFSKEM